MMYKGFRVRKSRYYKWFVNGPDARRKENEVPLVKIKDVFEASHETYSSPRITEELQVKEWNVSLNKVSRMMPDDGIQARKTAR